MTASFPMHISNSAREKFVACQQKWSLQYIDRIYPKERSVHLDFGAAYAAGLEASRKAFWQGSSSLDDALTAGAYALMREWGVENPTETHGTKNLWNCLISYDAYHQTFPMDSDNLRPYEFQPGHPMVEFSALAEIPGVRHPDTGDPLLYMAKCDMLGVYDDSPNFVWVVDDKTQGAANNWVQKWSLHNQMMGYVWTAQQYGIPAQGVVINTCVPYKAKPPLLDRTPIMMPQWKIERWIHNLTNDALNMVRAYESGTYTFNYGDACSAYGGCGYRTLCDAEHPEEWLNYYETRDAQAPLQNIGFKPEDASPVQVDPSADYSIRTFPMQ